LNNSAPDWTGRLDLNQSPNGLIDTLDIGLYLPRMGDLCSPDEP
jgi:hypothetical protein